VLLTSLALLLLAAVVHASSHALIKTSKDRLAFSWWMLGVSSVLGIPLLLLTPWPPSGAWPWIGLSGLLEALYFASLSRAYSVGDFSSTYPVARGSAPLFTLVWAILLLGERPSLPGIGGVVLIVAGILGLQSGPGALRHTTKERGAAGAAGEAGAAGAAGAAGEAGGLGLRALRWALLTGLLISGYSAVDKVGIRFVSPIPYLYFVLTAAWLALSPQWFSRKRRAALLHALGLGGRRPGQRGAGEREGQRGALGGDATDRENAHKRPSLQGPVGIVAAALLGFAAYVLVLTALRRSPLSYVGPVREISVVMSAWIGVRFLGERGGRGRIAAALSVAAGIALIALGG